jgi:hypothetical protein
MTLEEGNCRVPIYSVVREGWALGQKYKLRNPQPTAHFINLVSSQHALELT